MSIIYDALKKVEASKQIELETKPDKRPKSLPKIYLIYVLVMCAGIILAGVVFKGLSKSVSTSNPLILEENMSRGTSPSISVENKPAIPTEPQPTFVLNGVFFSGEEGYALINNRIVRKGDKIDGATVVGIALNEVELEAEGSVIRLSNLSR
jgi:hypothetical protein